MSSIIDVAAALLSLGLAAPEVTPVGHLETSYQLALDGFDSGPTELRGYDLQVGTTPAAYYAAEPSVGASDATLWRHVEEAWLGAHTLLAGRRLDVRAGLFLSPVGPESIAVHANWSWSRSNLFFALPAYHTGLRATLDAGCGWTLAAAVYDGWNSVTDRNADKSLSLQLAYSADALSFAALWLGGVERADDDPEGQPYRNLIDVWVSARVADSLELMGHLDGGFEPAASGNRGWLAGALYARLAVNDALRLALRVDAFREWGPGEGLFWPVDWVASQTLTLDWHPAEHLSVRLEYRHDQAAGDAYQDNHARAQDTLTLGATTWL